MKKTVSLLLALVLIMGSFAACGGGEEVVDENAYKIGIITGTVSQGEEEYQAAQNAKAKYGDMIVTATYPDNFSTETEATIAQVVGLASDPEVKAIVFVQAVPGAAAAIDKVRETRPDMLFIAGVVAEDPATIASKADICMLVDEISMGTAVIEQAAKQGAETFVHISFARHLSYATIAARRELFIATCEELGIEYVEATAPDPTGDAGVSGAQQWIIENVPALAAEYGPNTAFFSTNCAMMEPLIRTVAEQKAIFPQQCCPSPYHGYPAAFGIDVTGHEGDVAWMLEAIKGKVAEYDNTGRMSTWAVPVNMLMIEAGVEYAIAFCEGETSAALDEAVLFEKIKAIGGETVAISNFVDEAAGELDNFYMLLCPFYDF
ncbi:MAG: DUF3798 domain-containing protein [Bacillota bacterium]|jgi:hypothetical protein|nr:DUF3798 domain-containing protein [Eubacteriales bacterium]MDI9492850.1 DUF3798 domain-containing protein [Bacillota bacterium]NLV69259.1 DUF3798 domain-containing protein [Clostridiales bacterium]MDD3537736.1 DUF3798 domain-containing protein [Eubacteriales bacterium]MDD4286017.1 DUF3798 domain-containing protein [Eubacteriales bacterium]